MAEKRYFWLKLQEDFFSSKRIKKLRRLPGGDTLTIIYLKMQLLSIKTGGVLTYSGLESSFAEEIALDLDESEENVKLCIGYLLSCGLIETSDNISFMLPFAISNTGSEGASAKRMREARAMAKLPEPSQCANNVQQCSEKSELRYGESESDQELDKEKEINQSISIAEGITEKQLLWLYDTYENVSELIDLIDDRLVTNFERIKDPFAYVCKVAREERWMKK